MKKILIFALTVLALLLLVAAAPPPTSPAPDDVFLAGEPMMKHGDKDAKYEKKIDKMMEKLIHHIPNLQNVSIFYAEFVENDILVSCHIDKLNGMESVCAGFQDQSTAPFTWYMGEVFAAPGREPADRLIISDYETLPDDEPLKQYYPPFFYSVGDYPLFHDGQFIGWIGLLGTDPDNRIDWNQHTREFIARTIEKEMDSLAQDYYEDFLPGEAE